MKNERLLNKIHPYLILMVGCIGILGTIGTLISAKENGDIMSIEEKNVKMVVERMTAAFHNSDIEGVMATYEDEATVVFEPKKPISDQAIIREMFQGFFTLNPKFTYSGHEVFVENDLAIHIAPWTMKGKAPDGADIVQSGLSVAVLRRQTDGKWLMVIDNPHGGRLMSK